MSKVDSKVILYLLTVIDYMAADILKVFLAISGSLYIGSYACLLLFS